MDKRILACLFFIGILCFMPLSGHAGIVPVYNLINNPDKFDGKIVEVEGEVIGEVLFEKSGAWVNILSNGYNIGVFADNAGQFKKLKILGNFKYTGDTIRVKGVFYKTCPKHFERDLHFISMDILTAGNRRADYAPFYKIEMAWIFLIISLVTSIAYLLRLYDNRPKAR